MGSSGACCSRESSACRMKGMFRFYFDVYAQRDRVFFEPFTWISLKGIRECTVRELD